MAYDEGLAARIRSCLSGEPGLTERKMFGGLGFMLDGHMAVAAGSGGAMMIRVDPGLAEDYVGEHVRPTIMQGRELRGWLDVDPAQIVDDVELARLVAVGRDYVRELPPK